MYEMKQLSQRKVTHYEAAAYFGTVFNNTFMSIINQEDNIIQYYRDVATQAKANGKENLNRMPKRLRCLIIKDEVQASLQPNIPPMDCVQSLNL